MEGRLRIFPACMVLDTQLKLKSAGGEREVSVNEFFRGPGETTIEPNELLVSIHMRNSTSLDRRRVNKAWRPQDTGNFYGQCSYSIDAAITGWADR